MLWKRKNCPHWQFFCLVFPPVYHRPIWRTINQVQHSRPTWQSHLKICAFSMFIINDWMMDNSCWIWLHKIDWRTQANKIQQQNFIYGKSQGTLSFIKEIYIFPTMFVCQCESKDTIYRKWNNGWINGLYIRIDLDVLDYCNYNCCRHHFFFNLVFFLLSGLSCIQVES